ncbi:MAG TPA: FtsX-like permease family protein [Candidatus Bathyarchaeia archaeon]|nr:FtsX-like permease family protein [Candidatus Bathyarchaeia archaeon]
MFVQLLRKSILRRKSRFAMGVASVLIGAAVVTALFTVSLGVGDQVGQEFTKYGADLMLQPQSNTIQVGLPGVSIGSVTEQKYINESDLWMIKTIEHRANVLGFAPFLYQVVTVGEGPNAQQAVLAGTYFNKTIQIPQPASPQDPSEFSTGIADISSWWKVTGNWITDQNDTTSAMVGSNVAQKLNLTVGDSFKVSYAGAQNATTATNVKELKVAGIVESGGAEDNQIFVNLPVAQDLSSRPGKVDTVQVSALCVRCPVADMASEIQGKIPGVQGTTITQLTNAEMSTLDKYQSMMALVTAVALLASTMGIFTTMTANVTERRREIGLMKSIGAENRSIAALFLAEATLTGLIGGIGGFGAGIVLAQFIGLRVFSTTIPLRWEVLAVAIPIAIGVSLLASALPVRRATAVEPAIVLRGE